MNEATIEQRLDQALGSFDPATRQDIKQQVMPVVQELIEEALLDDLKTVTIEDGDIVLFGTRDGYSLPPSHFDRIIADLKEDMDLHGVSFLEGVDLETVDKGELERVLSDLEA